MPPAKRKIAASAKKPVAKKKAKRTPTDTATTIIIKTEATPVSALRPYYKNPNIGNPTEIAKSLHVNGQYKAITVNVGTFTGRKNEILAGNHTWMGARKEVIWTVGDTEYHKKPWDEIDASWVDVDDEEAARIVAADNRLSELGQRDPVALAELSQEYDLTLGTGYNQADVDSWTEQAAAAADEMLSERSDVDVSSVVGRMDLTDIGVEKRTGREALLDEEDEEDTERATRRGAARVREEEEGSGALEETPVTDALTEIQAILEIKEERFESFELDSNEWGIPQLREDMLVDALPSSIQCWAGDQVTPDDGKKWFLWQYSLGGMRGLPVDRSILCFYTHDWKFNGWWDTPAYYTAKALARGLTMAVCPDFSFYYTTPRVVHLHGVYRSQWLGRWFQEAGIKVIPRVQWANDSSFEFNLLGIPKNAPVIAMSIQNNPAESGDKKESHRILVAGAQRAIDEIEPTSQVLIYGGNPALRVMEDVDFHGATPVHVLNYAAERRRVVYDKQDGMGALSAKDKKKIKDGVRAKLGVESPDKKRANQEEEDEDF